MVTRSKFRRHLKKKKISRHGDLATGLYVEEIQKNFLTTSASVADMKLSVQYLWKRNRSRRAYNVLSQPRHNNSLLVTL